jgi:GNAT superfamily N-acetyltransferase
MSTGVICRAAVIGDVAGMAECRMTDPSVHAADPRMTAYFNGEHHPQLALMPRAGFVAFAQDRMIGYIVGHLTKRHGCAGEVQYLFVAPAWRKQGTASTLLRLLAKWFQENDAAKVCVCVDAGSPAAMPFYRSQGARPLAPHPRHWAVWEDIGVVLRPNNTLHRAS